MLVVVEVAVSLEIRPELEVLAAVVVEVTQLLARQELQTLVEVVAALVQPQELDLQVAMVALALSSFAIQIHM
jgi:hypothetical protein